MQRNLTGRLNPGAAAFIVASTIPSLAAASMLEEVVVTAQKRAQSLEEVPISISVVTSDQIENANINSANHLAEMVPGLRVDLAGAFSQPTIRGVGSSIAQVGASSNVATYVDGFYMASQLTTNAQLANLESVQVLKGPQGTLFGRNATGGAILIKTREPSTETSGRIKYSYGEFNTQRLQGYFTTGLTDDFAVDISGFYDDSDGWLENIANGDDQVGEYNRWGGRGSALWNVNDAISFKLAYEHNDWDDNTPLAANTYQGLGQSTPVEFGVGFSTDKPDKVALDSPAGFTAETDGWFLTGRFDLGWADLVSYTMVREEETGTNMELDGSAAIAPNPLWWAVTFDIESDTFSQEFNLSGTYGDKLEWVTGLFYYEFEDTYTSLTTQLPSFGFVEPADVYDSIGNDITSWAVFADVTYHMTDAWSVILGLRYSEEEGEGSIAVAPGNLLTLFPPPIAPGTYKDNETWDDTSPRAVLRYQLNDESNMYLSYTEGFKAGIVAASDTSVPLPIIEPEEIDAWEIGYKYASDNIRLNAAAFYYDYTNVQVASYIGISSITTNAASSEIYGAEVQLDALLNEHWSLNLGVAYTDAEYEKYLTAPHWEQDLGALPPGFVGLDGDASGNTMQRAPEWETNVGIQYETTLADGTFRAIGNYYYTSEFFLDPANQFEQDAYGLLNATVSWTTPNDRLTFAIFGTNLTDEDYRTQVLPGPPAILQTWAEPLSYGASVEYSF